MGLSGGEVFLGGTLAGLGLAEASANQKPQAPHGTQRGAGLSAQTHTGSWGLPWLPEHSRSPR